MTRTLIIAALIAGIAAAAQADAPKFSPVPVPRPPEQPETACDTRAYITAKLGETYGEVRLGVGLSGPDEALMIFELWASAATGTWTFLNTTPDGWACIVAVGDNWLDYTGVVEKIAADPA